MNTGIPQLSIIVSIIGTLVTGCVAISDQKTGAIASNGGYGPNPTLPKPRPTLIPTIRIAEAKGWRDGTAPTPAKGLRVNAFATGLDHPRWLHVLPNGDVLVAESNAPEKKGVGSASANWSWAPQ